MEQRRTIGQYRAIDLMIFALLLAAAETVMTRAGVAWFPREAYTVSCAGAITAIVMMRWGSFALLHAVIGGAAFCLASGATPSQYAIYCVGNAACLGALALRRHFTPEGIRQDAFKSVVFGLVTVLLMQLGRGVVSLLFGGGAADVIRFFSTDIITTLFTAVVVWVARHQNGLFEDQMNYLSRLAAEQEKEKETHT